MRDAVLFWLVAELIGLAALPAAAFLFARLPGRGLALARPLGLLLLAYPAWQLASLHIVPYGRASVLIGVAVLVGLAVLLRGHALAALRLSEARRIWLAGEALFAVAFAGWALLRSFAPDVWNTEKPMDMAFVNAVNRSDSFPPHDPWFAGETLNYYYYGHYLVALLVRATGTAPEIGFNVAVALFYALVATAVFAVAAGLSLARRGGGGAGRAIVDGCAAAVIAVALGTLAGAAGFFGDGRRLRDYDWWSPSRVIDGTANEFPFFSFLLGDLHAHVMATPFALLAVALALQLALAGPRLPARGTRAAVAGEVLLAALVLGSLYAVNSLDLPTAAVLVAAGLVLWLTSGDPGRRIGASLAWLGLVLAAALALFAPFVAAYEPTTEGLGLVREHDPFTRFAGDIALIYALPLLIVAAALAGRLRVPGRYLAWSGTAVLVALVLLAPSRLAGLLLALTLGAIAVHAALDSGLPQPDRFFWLLVAAGLGLIAVGEFAYVRDAFDGTSSYRFNTVFKAGYQAWFLLSIAAGVGLRWAGVWLRRRPLRAWQAAVGIVLVLLAVYPVAGSYARNEGFTRTPTLDGLSWLEARASGDVAAIEWLRRVDGTPVVLESVGPDFSQLGHARISTFTGLPTVIGWLGHEVQWGHEPGRRAEDVETIYRTRELARARRLLERYDVRYVVVGPLERAEYGSASLAKFERLGERVFRSGATEVYAVGG